MFIGIYSRCQVSVYRTVGPLDLSFYDQDHWSSGFIILWVFENELEFYNFDDVYVTTHEIKFAIVQLFGLHSRPCLIPTITHDGIFC